MDVEAKNIQKFWNRLLGERTMANDNERARGCNDSLKHLFYYTTGLLFETVMRISRRHIGKRRLRITALF